MADRYSTGDLLTFAAAPLFVLGPVSILGVQSIVEHTVSAWAWLYVAPIVAAAVANVLLVVALIAAAVGRRRACG